MANFRPLVVLTVLVSVLVISQVADGCYCRGHRLGSCGCARESCSGVSLLGPRRVYEYVGGACHYKALGGGCDSGCAHGGHGLVHTHPKCLHGHHSVLGLGCGLKSRLRCKLERRCRRRKALLRCGCGFVKCICNHLTDSKCGCDHESGCDGNCH